MWVVAMFTPGSWPSGIVLPLEARRLAFELECVVLFWKPSFQVSGLELWRGANLGYWIPRSVRYERLLEEEGRVGGMHVTRLQYRVGRETYHILVMQGRDESKKSSGHDVNWYGVSKPLWGWII